METEEVGCERIIDDVLETLKLASIKEHDLNDITQILYSGPECNSNEKIKLLELNDNLLEALKEGDCLSFKGSKNEPVVLCTKNQTYNIKEAETSNSCLLVPNLKFSKHSNTPENNRTIEKCSISGIFHTYFEVAECRPKLEQLLTVLEASSFKGLEYESELDPEVLYNWDRLQSDIQASEEELKQALTDYLIVNIDGYFRHISFECEARSLTLLLDLFDENSWELDEVDDEITYDSLKELIPKPVFEILLKKYTQPSEKTKKNGTPLFRYDEEACCKTLAKVLLAASPVTEYKQFMESWGIGTPEKMQPKVEHLSGIALITGNNLSLKREVVSFPEVNLPKNVLERFNELFKAKDKWTVSEITPYVLGSTTSTMNVNALLTKYARCSTVNGTKYYSSKHGK